VVGVTEDLERRDQAVRVRVARGDLESWRRAAGPLGNVSGWLRQAASKATATRMAVVGSELARGVPVEVVELRASTSEAASWREAAGDRGLASWLRSVAAAELATVGAPVPADVKLPDDGAGGPSVAQEARSPAPGQPSTPASSAALQEAPATSGAPPRPFPGEDAEDRWRRSMTIADVLACPHPATDRKVTGYMTMCVVCGRLQQGRDRWGGAGYAAWTAGWQAACPHPATDRLSHAWGTQCGVCGRLLRG